MPGMLEEVTLTFDDVYCQFNNSNVAILNCHQQPRDDEDVQDAPEGSLRSSRAVNKVRVKAEYEPNELVSGLDYRFYGRWNEHERYGRQFHAKTYVKTTPHGRRGTIRYLMQAEGIGQVGATKLWDKFGSKAVEIAREQPDVTAAAIGGQFNIDRATRAATYFLQQQAIEATMIDLMDLLDGRGFPKTTSKSAVQEWGNQAAVLIRRNPYLLMRFRGCGFLRCDQLYLDLGGDPAKLKRQALCAWHAVASNTSGDTWFRPEQIERDIRSRVSGVDVRPVDAVRLARRAKILCTRRDENGALWIAEAKNAGHERTIAESVHAWLSRSSAWPSVDDLDVSDHQREIASRALSGQVSIITGGPGSGKTYLSARIVAKVIAKHGAGQVAVAAPTGKAAVRITEALAGYGINKRATTIHSLLKVRGSSQGGGWQFEHNAGNPLPFKFVICDESSMIDAGLAAAFFSACGTGTHLLLVGDTGQLPPVGHGAPMRDLINAGVPCGELTEIRRNSGRIVESCHEIRKGSRFKLSPNLDPDAGENLRLLPAPQPEQTIDRIVSTIKTIGRRGLANPIWGCQVIVAVNNKSQLSRKLINKRLQAEINPTGKQEGSNPFRVGDKIVCLKNSFTPAVKDAPKEFNKEKNEDSKVFIANGEQAEVKHVEQRMTVAQLDSPPRLVLIPRGTGSASEQGAESEDSSGSGCDWDLAYAISCHKSQGSEWPIVLVVLDEYPGAKLVCSRSWIYTAISRAKQACFLVGKLSTAFDMVGRDVISKRKTFAKELILEGKEELK